MNNKPRNKFWQRLTVASIIMALMLSALNLIGLTLAPHAAKASEIDFAPVSLSLSNGEFDSSSGSFPAAPSSWSESLASGSNKGSTVAGVLDLDTYNEESNILAAKLDKYDEYKGGIVPKTPFGENNTLKGDKKFLMINTTPATTTSISYKSSAVTLEKSKFYRVSAWVKTGNFSPNSGASIRLDGLGGNYAFSNINTVKDLSDLDNDVWGGNKVYGWRQYTFHIASSPLETKSLVVSLGVGDYYLSDDGNDLEVNHAKGYAFFDKVTAEEVSAYEYFATTQEGSYIPDYDCVVDLGLETAFDSDETAKSFGFENWDANWTRVSTATQGSTINSFSANAVIVEGNDFNLETSPRSSLGWNNGDNPSYLDNILIMSSYDKSESYTKVSVGVESKPLTIERFKFYRLSAWVKTDNITDGSGASMVVKTNKFQDGSEDKFVSFPATLLTSDEVTSSRYGWKEYAFYIKGSTITEYSIQLQLWLGQEDNESKGTAMFHNVRFDTITYSQYTAHNSDGTTVEFDSSLNNSVGFTNTSFLEAGDYTDYEFPLAPAGWTYINAGTAGTFGHSSSTAIAKFDNIIKGIVPLDGTYFDNLAKNNSSFNLINPKRDEIGNVLVLSSTDATAIGYRSSEYSVTASSVNKITVSMMVDGIQGYGANIVVKSGSKVIGSIEKITSTYSGNNVRGFKSFTFYVEGGLSDNSVSVEVWLGLNDRVDNSKKLSSGNVYVEKITAETTTEAFAQINNSISESKSNNRLLDTNAYSFAGESFNGFDYYDESYVKYPFNWNIASVNGSNISNVRYGIFDAANRPSVDSEIPQTFKNSVGGSNHVLMLFNAVPTASTLTLDRNIELEASKAYQISVTLKTDLHLDENSIGAGIVLTNTDFKFENITSTVTTTDQTVDTESFKTFTFYVKTGEDSKNVGIALTLGGSLTKEHVQGRVYVNNINWNEISVELFDDLTGSITRETSTYNLKADLSTPVAVDSGDEGIEGGKNGDINWWLIPSILASVAMLLALVGVVIRKVIDSVNQKRTVKYETSSSYDRNTTLNKIHNDNTTEEQSKVKATSLAYDKQYEEFDDVLPPAPSKLKDKPQPEVFEDVKEDVKAEEATSSPDAESEAAATEADTTETNTTQTTTVENEKPAEKQTDPYTNFDD